MSTWVPTEEGSDVRVVQGDDGRWFGQERWPDEPDEITAVCGERFDDRATAAEDTADHFAAMTDEAVATLSGSGVEAGPLSPEQVERLREILSPAARRYAARHASD